MRGQGQGGGVVNGVDPPVSKRRLASTLCSRSSWVRQPSAQWTGPSAAATTGNWRPFPPTRYPQHALNLASRSRVPQEMDSGNSRRVAFEPGITESTLRAPNGSTINRRQSLAPVGSDGALGPGERWQQLMCGIPLLPSPVTCRASGPAPHPALRAAHSQGREQEEPRAGGPDQPAQRRSRRQASRDRPDADADAGG